MSKFNSSTIISHGNFGKLLATQSYSYVENLNWKFSRRTATLKKTCNNFFGKLLFLLSNSSCLRQVQILKENRNSPKSRMATHLSSTMTFLRHCTCSWQLPAAATAMLWYTRMNESGFAYKWVVSHMWMSHVVHVSGSCRTHEWVMWRLPAAATTMLWYTYMNESCLAYE